MGWLFTIAGFVAKEMRRSSLRRRKHEGRLGDTENLAAPHREGAALAEAREREERVHAALDELAEDERVIIELSVYANLSQTEIATALGVSLATVKNRTRSGQAKLLTLLKDVDI